MESVVEKYESEKFDLEGKVVLHDVKSVHPKLPPVDPKVNQLEVALVDDLYVWISVTSYDEANTAKFADGRDAYEKTKDLVRGGNYRLHIFANGELNLSDE